MQLVWTIIGTLSLLGGGVLVADGIRRAIEPNPFMAEVARQQRGWNERL